MATSTQQFKAILSFLRPYRKLLQGLILLTAVISIVSMMPPLVIRAIIDRVITQGERQLLFGLGACLLGIPLALAFCQFIQTLGLAYLGQRFVFDVRVSLYNHFLTLSLRFFSKHSTGKLVNRLMGDSGIVQRMLTGQTINIVSDLISAVFAITATFLISWRLALLLLLVVSVFVLNYRLNIGKIRQATRGYRGALDRVSGGVQNRLTANLAVKTFGTEKREQGTFRGESDASLDLIQQAFVSSNTFQMNTQLIQGVGRAILFFGGCALVLKGSMSYADVVAFTAYAMRLLGPAVRFSQLAKQLQDVSIAIDRLFEVFDQPPEIQDAPDAQEISVLDGKVDFNDVYFHYEKHNPVLQGFDLHVAPGQTVALIGPTGCGKSTILSLLLRAYDVVGGQLLIDDTDIHKIKLDSLRKQFGIVLQEPLLFDVSIAENIRYAKPGATMNDIERAARVTEIHDFIASLPHGYDTKIGSEGVELSVGQKQRITIARAVAADPAILIMDEATSALDSDSEQAIQKAMDQLLKNRTSFVVAHRLSTKRNADCIVLLKDGKIDEKGTHDELMRIPSGRYRDLYNKHMGSGVLEE
ncbi:MAG: ABC transporter ATP-binding protein/permease [Candidatus Pacebacteria bacterium]|nr:ABC transporter ATP-binding protein/permease [Candidatus Paceibacterota bacterium]